MSEEAAAVGGDWVCIEETEDDEVARAVVEALEAAGLDVRKTGPARGAEPVFEVEVRLDDLDSALDALEEYDAAD